jgi:hypothetical protein
MDEGDAVTSRRVVHVVGLGSVGDYALKGHDTGGVQLVIGCRRCSP